ncbi:hypothetical protein M514_11887, partial [Trichuris suis]
GPKQQDVTPAPTTPLTAASILTTLPSVKEQEENSTPPRDLQVSTEITTEDYRKDEQNGSSTTPTSRSPIEENDLGLSFLKVPVEASLCQFHKSFQELIEMYDLSFFGEQKKPSPTPVDGRKPESVNTTTATAKKVSRNDSSVVQDKQEKEVLPSKTTTKVTENDSSSIPTQRTPVTYAKQEVNRATTPSTPSAQTQQNPEKVTLSTPASVEQDTKKVTLTTAAAPIKQKPQQVALSTPAVKEQESQHVPISTPASKKQQSQQVTTSKPAPKKQEPQKDILTTAAQIKQEPQKDILTTAAPIKQQPQQVTTSKPTPKKQQSQQVTTSKPASKKEEPQKDILTTAARIKQQSQQVATSKPTPKKQESKQVILTTAASIKQEPVENALSTLAARTEQEAVQAGSSTPSSPIGQKATSGRNIGMARATVRAGAKLPFTSPAYLPGMQLSFSFMENARSMAITLTAGKEQLFVLGMEGGIGACWLRKTLSTFQEWLTTTAVDKDRFKMMPPVRQNGTRYIWLYLLQDKIRIIDEPDGHEKGERYISCDLAGRNDIKVKVEGDIYLYQYFPA